MESSKPKRVNSILNILRVDSFRLGDLKYCTYTNVGFHVRVC